MFHRLIGKFRWERGLFFNFQIGHLELAETRFSVFISIFRYYRWPDPLPYSPLSKKTFLRHFLVWVLPIFSHLQPCCWRAQLHLLPIAARGLQVDPPETLSAPGWTRPHTSTSPYRASGAWHGFCSHKGLSVKYSQCSLLPTCVPETEHWNF